MSTRMRASADQPFSFRCEDTGIEITTGSRMEDFVVLMTMNNDLPAL